EPVVRDDEDARLGADVLEDAADRLVAALVDLVDDPAVLGSLLVERVRRVRVVPESVLAPVELGEDAHEEVGIVAVEEPERELLAQGDRAIEPTRARARG